MRSAVGPGGTVRTYVLSLTVALNLLRMELHRNAPVEGLGPTMSQNFKLNPVTVPCLSNIAGVNNHEITASPLFMIPKNLARDR